MEWPTEAEFREWVLEALSSVSGPITSLDICTIISAAQTPDAPWAVFPVLAYYSSVEKLLLVLTAEGLVRMSLANTPAGVSTYHYEMSILDRLARESVARPSAGREAPGLDPGGPGHPG